MTTITACALVVALFAIQVDSSKKYEPTFEYEYKVLQTLVNLEEEDEKIKSTLNGGTQRITELSEMFKATYETIQHMNATINILRSNDLGSGSTYIRWGRTTCDGDAKVVYDGYSAGAWYTHSGSGSNYLCLTKKPKMPQTTDGRSFGLVYGVEYELGGKHHDHDAPCVVCRIPRSDVLMTPGTDECEAGWVQEYSGYLVSAYYGHQRTQFICLDKDIEYLNSGDSDQNGALFYYVKGSCGSLRCPPYENDRELSCAVCSYGKRG